MKDEALAERCRALKLILTDVDGVMTDGTVLLLPDGGEAKAFHIEAILRARGEWDEATAAIGRGLP
jgi:3-deoxy-D-manno-octulosonate 8-phosphate phosphatase KdsC-like HAD superfamily phosphatase